MSRDDQGVPAAFEGQHGLALAAAFDDLGGCPAQRPDSSDRGLSRGVRDRIRRSYRATAAGHGARICGFMVRSRRASPNAIGSFSGASSKASGRLRLLTIPWLSRPMRHELGLDLPERRIGLSAHDFAQLLGAEDVILSHAAKSVAPRRWHRASCTGSRRSRVKTAGSAAMQAGARYVQYAEALDQPDKVTPIAQPAPKPPRATRPQNSRSPRSRIGCAIPTPSMPNTF